jgi:hypothetical protein
LGAERGRRGFGGLIEVPAKQRPWGVAPWELIEGWLGSEALELSGAWELSEA